MDILKCKLQQGLSKRWAMGGCLFLCRLHASSRNLGPAFWSIPDFLHKHRLGSESAVPAVQVGPGGERIEVLKPSAAYCTDILHDCLQRKWMFPTQRMLSREDDPSPLFPSDFFSNINSNKDEQVCYIIRCFSSKQV